jgi:hypothetical protein
MCRLIRKKQEQVFQRSDSRYTAAALKIRFCFPQIIPNILHYNIHYILYIILFVLFYVSSLSAQERTAPLLGNPMEKTFNSGTIRESDGAAADAFRRAPLPTGTLPQTAADNTGQTFNGWDIGPPAVASGTNTTSSNTAGNTATNNSAADFNAANSNIGNTLFATTFSPANPNLSQNFSNPQYNSQYNPPQYDYSALAAQYASQMQNYYQNYNNPYNAPNYVPSNGYASYNMPYGANQYSANPYGQYGVNQYGVNQYGGNPYSMNQYGTNPYGAAGTAGLSGTPSAAKGDLFGNMMMSGAFEQNPVLYQAMLQQEELRHQQSLEEEEEKEKEAGEKEKGEHWSAADYMPPIAGTFVSCLKTISPFNTPTGPDRGVGMPLMNRSWLDRPFYAGGFVGKMSGSKLVSNMIDQKDGANGGFIVGFNVNDYWGLDGRLHFASLDIRETSNGENVYQNWYAATNPGAFIPPLTTRTNQMTIVDVSVHYYPLGNAKFRPFVKYGIGAVRETFKDTYGVKHHIDTMAMPFGVGLKYWWNERLAIQMDVVDNIIFSRDITKTQNNWAFSVGVTYSFGSSKKRKPVSYWPYTPSNGSRH